MRKGRLSRAAHPQLPGLLRLMRDIFSERAIMSHGLPPVPTREEEVRREAERIMALDAVSRREAIEQHGRWLTGWDVLVSKFSRDVLMALLPMLEQRKVV